MKYLRLFESSKKSIINNCQIYTIRNYIINKDGSIDVDGNVDLTDIDFEGFDGLPLNFRNVTGSFYCSYCILTTLKGCPIRVDGNFICSHNRLTSLEGGPKSIGGRFDCCSSRLTTLEGCPELVGGDFWCGNNNITTFEHLPFSIGGDFYCDMNPIYNVWKLFFDYSKIEFLNDCDALREPNIIILDRLNYFLEEVGKKPVKRVRGYKCI